MDDDDRPGYLMDYISSWVKENEIDSEERFNEKFQSDDWNDTVIEFAEEVLKTAGVFKRNEE